MNIVPTTPRRISLRVKPIKPKSVIVPQPGHRNVKGALWAQQHLEPSIRRQIARGHSYMKKCMKKCMKKKEKAHRKFKKKLKKIMLDSLLGSLPMMI